MTPLIGGRITAGFEDPRPLSNPGLHIHGALDLAGGDGVVRAPVDGSAQGFVIFRGVDPAKGRRSWGQGPAEKPDIKNFPWREYWEDVYGGFVVLVEGNGRLHIMCHVWPAQILNPCEGMPFRFAYYIEEAAKTRYPCHMLLTEPRQVKMGQPLAKVGDAGDSTGPHVHWEIHHQADRLDDYKDRIRPQEYMKDAPRPAR